MLANLFESYGERCAKYPWEVIVSVLTVTACLFSMDTSSVFSSGHTHSMNTLRTEETNAVDIIFMTIIRCTAVLYSYYQFRKLRKLGSNYILGIAGLFTVFSSFVFSSTVINFLQTDVSDLKDALFFFVLVIDLSKASVLAQFALNSCNQKEVNRNIARGMALLGPTITLDTLVGTLVISVGTLSGVKRLETLCSFACFSFVVNYLVFMTFYPACLSLVLELSRSGSYEKRTYEIKSSLVELLYDEGHKPNPVVQRVKVIMSAGMMIVHVHSRWSLNNMDSSSEANKIFSSMSGIPSHTIGRNDTEAADIQGYLMRFLAMRIDHIVILILFLALTVIFVFFDDKEELADQVLQNEQLYGRVRKLEPINEYRAQSVTENYSQTESVEKPLVSASCQTDVFKVGNDADVNDEKESVLTQTEIVECENDMQHNTPPRSIEECHTIFIKHGSVEQLTNQEICKLVDVQIIRAHDLENRVKNPVRGVGLRRAILSEKGGFQEALEHLPYLNYDYTKVMGACCENVIGYIPVPVGIAGPLLLDGKQYYVPMATTEGCLVASTNRGCKALSMCNGISSRVVFDGMSRGPVVRFPSIQMASEAMMWINDGKNYAAIKSHFDGTSRFARLQTIQVRIAGRHLFIRFTATTGDAMGMNMTSKGTEYALKFIKENFSEMEIISISGNFCTDKKPAAINWIEGRGKGVVCEAIISQKVLEKFFRTTAHRLVEVNMSKNMMGSAMAGSIGGFNAHAANIVTAIYIATGQDPAQNVCSSNCMTFMEPHGNDGTDLYISCSMPSIEIGTVGGGTNLPAQASCLDILGVKGANDANPGDNAKSLARIVCAAVLAGELSLMAALCAGELVQSHLTLNRTSVSEKSNETRTRKCGIVMNSTIPGQCIPT